MRFTRVLQCYFIQTIFTKHIKLQTSRFLVKKCFLACQALFLVFYSVKFVWCKICIFLVFCSHSRCQRQKMGANISLHVFIERSKNTCFLVCFWQVSETCILFLCFSENILLRYSSLGLFSRVLQSFTKNI